MHPRPRKDSSIFGEENRTKSKFFGTLWDSYADLYFLKSIRARDLTKILVPLPGERQPRKPNIVILVTALR